MTGSESTLFAYGGKLKVINKGDTDGEHNNIALDFNFILIKIKYKQ